uniref:Uncharacterized protein n=1 Tax=Biomphalaria glabrata TaxID=6526 RepID=A0A2C9M623_BIOGL
MVNVKDEPVTINLPQFSGQAVDVYWFTSGGEDVLSLDIRLNDVLMDSSGKNGISFTPKSIQGSIEMPALSYGFIVIPDANVEKCRDQPPTTTPRSRALVTKHYEYSRSSGAALKMWFVNLCLTLYFIVM